MNERITVLENKVDALMEVRGGFTSEHQIFGKLVHVLLEEPTLNRKLILENQKKIEELYKRLQEDPPLDSGSTFSDSFSSLDDAEFYRLPRCSKSPKNFSSKIDNDQKVELRELVKEKGVTRKGIFEIWHQFKQKFQLKSYQDLPSIQFRQALRWINQF